MNRPFSFVAIILLLHTSFEVYPSAQKSVQLKSAGCRAPTAQRDLDINNVRTTILNGGDMWWNLNNARYEVPKVKSGEVAKNALSAGGLWYGAVTNGNIRLACQTYRQNGNDIYPGPLVNNTAYITEETCKKYDRIWSITFQEINSFRVNAQNWKNPSEEIATWPCMGVPGGAKYLAPFFDNDYDGEYNPANGDYPSFMQDVENNIPDKMLFWINNDKGNIHSETQGLPIGIEMHSFAFAYQSNDEINNTTFYKTTIFNRGNEVLDSFIFAHWADPGIGNENDDYVQFDASRNLVIAYNADNDDEGILGYGVIPPCVGIRMFEGPVENSQKIPLRSFVSFYNDFSVQGSPSRPEHFWNYMNGRWKDGSPITYGGNGKGGADTASFMYPGFSDPAARREWTEGTESNTPGDRRTLVSYAPFSLLPGAVNTISYAVVWARSNNSVQDAMNMLKVASDKAYAVYQKNFFFTPVSEVAAKANHINVYPNPGINFFSIDDPTGSVARVDFYTLSGKHILSSSIYSKQQINLDELESGIYFYTLKSNADQPIMSGKWLKN